MLTIAAIGQTRVFQHGPTVDSCAVSHFAEATTGAAIAATQILAVAKVYAAVAEIVAA